MRKSLILPLLALFPGLGCAKLPVWQGNFDAQPWETAFFPQWGPQHMDRDEVVYDEELKSKVLRVKYPAGGVGPATGGMQFLTRFGAHGHPFSPKKERLFIRYSLYFEPGFDFVKGGKLPGLAGNTDLKKTPKTGGGGEPKNDKEGFSARIMWREGGRACQYVYHPGQGAEYGADYFWEKDGQPVHFQTGVWHCVVTEVALNTPGKKDARLRSWLDGALVLDKGGIMLRQGKELSINAFYFSTFHGGADPSWAPKNDSFIRFSTVSVSAGPLECGTEARR